MAKTNASLVLAFLCAATGALAQGVDGIFGAVGGMMAAAQMQAAREAWSREPELRLYCLQRLLSRDGISQSRLIQAGVVPGDPRLSSIRSQCIRLDPGNLRASFRCTVPDESGSPVTTTCDQAFGRREHGAKPTIVDARVAIDLHLSGSPVDIVEIENAAGRQERLAKVEGRQRLLELARLRVEVEPYRASKSEMVRSQTQAILQRVASAGTSDNPPGHDVLEAIRRERIQLVQLEQLEIGRLAALDKLTGFKGTVERRALTAKSELRDEIGALEAEYMGIVRQPPPKPRVIPTQKIGPTFDCGKAKSPIEKLICAEDALSRLDLEMVQSYYTLRQLLPDQRSELRQDATDQSRKAMELCGLSDKGVVAPARIRSATTCVTTQYRLQRDYWRARVEREASALAREEAARPVQEHVRLQWLLQTAGYIPASENIDGIYGGGTRSAIVSFQTAEGLAADGLMSAQTASRLEQRASQPVAATPAALDSGTTARIVALHAKYAALQAKLDREDAVAARRQKLIESLADARRAIDDAMALNLPPRWRQVVDRLDEQMKTASPTPDDATLTQHLNDFEAQKAALQEAITVLKAITPRNRLLFDGDGKDILVLHNDTGRAPSVVKNIKGELVFEASRTLACQPHGGGLETLRARALNAQLKPWKQSLKFPLPRCDLRSITGNDLVVIVRDEWLKEKGGDLATLLSAVEAGVFAVMVTASARESQAMAQAEAVRALEVEGAVEKGDEPGFALALLETRSSIVCMAGVGNREAHEQVLRAHNVRIEDELRGPPTYVATSPDAAFIASKRGQCGAIYGSTVDLKSVVSALRRDAQSFRFFPLLMSPTEIDAAQRSLDEAKGRDIQQEADRRRRIEDEKRLEAEKQGDQKAVNARKQADLQREFGVMARAFEGMLTSEIKGLVEGTSERAAQKYPKLAVFYRSQLQDKWELMAVDTALIDYGVVDFKNRSLETAFAKSNIRMRNRFLGEYKTHCL
jgi:peptidoglycan hydrolase-like protein with peptidoglycan-binding domain